MSETVIDSRKLLIPEVIQSSAMDCGPACLAALLAGFGKKVSYSRLREACQTDIDGTSIDVIEEVAGKLGLQATQQMVPIDHLLMTEAAAIPSMVVTQGPTGSPHFVVAWRRHGGLIQVMDPAEGRLFRTRPGFLQDVFIHSMSVTPEFARQWFTAPAFLDPLRRRLADVGLSVVQIADQIERGLADRTWHSIAALDAVTRLAGQLVSVGAIEPGASVAHFVDRFAAEAGQGNAETALKLIPAQYWSAGALSDDQVELRGVVILHVAGTQSLQAEPIQPPDLPMSRELASAAQGESVHPFRAILTAAFADNRIEVLTILPALLLAGAATAIEGLLFSQLVAISQKTGSNSDPSPHLVLIGTFLGLCLLLDVALCSVLLRLGRWLELHLRFLLLEKLPRLGNYYFHSRLKSDMAQRAYEIRSLRHFPALLGQGIRILSEVAVTVAGIIWLWPGIALPAVVGALLTVGLPLAILPVLKEQDLRRQTHTGALARFYLDSLLGLTPLQAHRAEKSVRTEHETLLAKWATTVSALYGTQLGGLGFSLLAGMSFVAWLITQAVAQGSGGAQAILAVYWALKLPTLSQSLGQCIRQIPGMQNQVLRLFDVISGPEESEVYENPNEAPKSRLDAETQNQKSTGVHVLIRDVTVQAGGHTILSAVDLDIEPGEHVAIVGLSGSGKSSLVGLLLGWHRASAGSIRVDGEDLQAAQIRKLRRETAWVDPSIQIWNRSFSQNISYGNGVVSASAVREIVQSVGLADVVKRLPLGIDSSLGEGGGLVSGGEGQRIRLARAMLRKGVRLAILDEPFRGLDHDQRSELLTVVRRHFRDATLLYVSHDIDTALHFGRVLVIDGGRIIEDGSPAELLERTGSHLAMLKQAQDALFQEIWRNPVWRRWQMERGKLTELRREES